MTSTAEIKVTVDIPEQATIDLIKKMGAEIADCYERLDRFGELIGVGPCPRNADLIESAQTFLSGIKARNGVTKSPATEGDWSCPKCGYINPSDDGDCRICMTS